MSEQDSFADLMGRLRAGDPGAAAAVFRRFSQRLIVLARARLESTVGAREEAEDVLQSVFRSFFVRQRQGQFELPDWDSLWTLLTVITVRKCGNRVEYFHAARRDVSRERPLAAATSSGGGWHALAREPTPPWRPPCSPRRSSR